MFLVPVEVECYAGYKGQESPRAFQWGGERIEIEEILDRWFEGGIDPRRPPCDYFKVRCASGRECVLKLDRATDQWFIVDGFRSER